MRRIITFLSHLFMSFIFSFLLISCGDNAGLGATIDTKSPSLSIDYPESGVAIRESFILAGTCSDDKKITKISVTVKSLDKLASDKGYVDDSFLASMSLDESSWSITLNDYDEENPDYYNGWRYPDGKYEVSVTAFDNAGNNSGTYSRTFEIDNTPPVFIISNPGVIKNSDKTPSAYGSVFTIEGTISDNHTIAYMDVQIFDTDGNCISSETYNEENLPFFREEEISTAGGSSVQIAQYGSTSNNRYASLHPADSGTEYYYAQVTLTDSTKVYKNPPKSNSRSAAQLKDDAYGNASSKVYLYDSVYKPLMSARNGMGLSASDLKDILAGLETNDAALQILNDNAIDTALSPDDDSMKNKLSFSLNPESNPLYNVNGFSFNFGGSTNQMASCGNTVSVTVSAGFDKTNVDPDSVKFWLKHFNSKPASASEVTEDLNRLQAKVNILENAAQESDEYPFVVASEATNDSPATTVNTKDGEDSWILLYDYYKANNLKPSGSVATKTFSVVLPSEGINLNEYYMFGVTGKDVEDIVFSQDTIYGFVGNAAGVPPTITYDEPLNLPVLKEFPVFKGTAKITSTGYVISEIDAEFKITDESTNEVIKTFTEKITSRVKADKTVEWNASESGALYWAGNDTWAFDPKKSAVLMDLYNEKAVVSDTNEGAHLLCTVNVTAKSSSGHDGSASGSVHIDTVSPVVQITSVTPLISGEEYFGNGDTNNYLNGKIAIRGNVIEQNLKEGDEAVIYDIWASTDLTKELSESDSILDGLSAHNDEYGVDFDGKLGRAFTISLTDFPTTVISRYFHDYLGAGEDDKIQIELVFTAEDKAGNKGSYSSKTLNGGKNFVIYQETDRPKIALENASSDIDDPSKITTENNLFGTQSNNKLQINFSDDDSVNTVVVTLFDKDGNKVADENTYYGINPYSINPKKASYTLRYILPGTEGVYKVKVEAEDNNYIESSLSSSSVNKKVLQDFYIAVDSGAPNIIIDTASGYKPNGFEISGSISPSSKVFGSGKCSISAKFIDNDEKELETQPATVNFTSQSGNDWASTVIFPSSAVSDKYTVLFTVTDEYGQSNSAKFAFIIDTKAPEISENSADKTVYLDEAQYAQISAKVTDDYSGVAFAGYYLSTTDTAPATFDGVQWTQMNQGKDNVWSGTVSIEEYALANNCYDDNVYVFYSAKDNAGNSKILDGKTVISLDKQLPVLKIKKIADDEELADGDTLLTNDKAKTLYAEIYDTNVDSLAAVTASDTESVKIITVGTAEDILSEGKVVGKKYPITVNPWTNNNGDIEESYTIAFTASDKKSRIANKSVTLFCDNKAPVAVHEFDAKNKDIYFRIGDAAYGSVEDVGGKYSSGTYGNASTILIRGNFKESESGSGISFIYYLLTQEEPSADFINDFKTNYANKKTGYFSILASPEERTVGYNTTAEGALTDKTVVSNFKTNISGFNEGNNYLLLLAVDKAGNAQIDEADGSNYYSINVDNGLPIFEKELEIILNSGTEDIEIEGFVTDKDSGIHDVVAYVTVNNVTSYAEVEIKSEPGDENDENRVKWTATLDKEAFADVNKGTYTVYAKATDNAGAGNTQTISVANITIDKIPPTVTLVKPADADTSTADIEINGTIDLSGTISDENMLPETAILAIEYSTDYTEASAESATWTALPVYSEENENGIKLSGNYTYKGENFVTTSLQDESYYYLRAKGTDKAGNIGYSEPFKVKISQDTDRPVVKITNLTYRAGDSENPYVLKYGTKSQIIALVSDDDGIDTVQFSDDKITAKVDSLPNSVYSNGTVTFTPKADYEANKNIDAKKSVYIYVKDASGKEYYTTYKTDNGADDYLNVPKIRVNDHELSNDDCTKVFKYRSDSTAPKVEELKSQAYRSDGTTENGTAETVSAGYIIGGSEKPKAKFIVTASDESQIEGIAIEITYNKDGSEFTRKYRSSDKVADDSYDVNGNFVVSAEDSKKSTWTTDALSLAEADTGSIKVNVIPYDKLGLIGNGNFSFYVDNSAPVIEVQTPETGREVTGSVTIRGMADDLGNAATDTIYWLVPTKVQATAFNAKTSDAEKLEYLQGLSWNGGINSLVAGRSASSWEFAFDGNFDAESSDTDNFSFVAGNPLFEVYDSETFATEIQDGIYTLPVYFLALDKLGNTSWKTDYYIKHNPDADRPKLEFTYPTTDNYKSEDEPYAVLGGTIRATGSATIPSATTTVKSIFYQIADENASFSDSDKTKAESTYGYTILSAYDVLNDVLGTTSFTSSSTLTEEQLKKYGFASNAEVKKWWGIKSSGTGSWNFSLNSNGELNPSADSTNNITIRACGVNAEGKFGAWTTENNVISIHVDKTAPTISALVNQYANGTAAITAVPTTAYTSSQNYESGLYLRGYWTLVATLLDETGVNRFSVLDGEKALKKGTGYFVEEAITENGKQGVRLYIPIPKDKTSVELTVNADDAEHSASQTFTFTIDETAPSLDALKGNGTEFGDTFESIEDSNYQFILSGSSTDDGSGLKNILFYYMRKAGTTQASIGTNVVMDPMITSSTDDAKVPMSGLTARTFTQGSDTFSLYAKAYTGTATTETFTSDSAYDAHVRVGGVVEIDGILHTISAISGKTVTFSPSLSAAKTTSFTAYFPIAQVIDNSATEKVSSYSANPFTFEKGDDGDKMPESFSKSGKTWTWDSTIHSNNMPDGPVSLVILAFDNAGNVAGKTINTKITNNAPRLAKVFLGTDLSGDGKYVNSSSLTEIVEYDILGAEGVTQKTYTLDFTEKQSDGTTAKYNNGIFKIKNGLAVIPELTGGNGDIGMVLKTGATSATAVTGTVTNATSSSSETGTAGNISASFTGTVEGTFAGSNASYKMHSFIVAKANLGSDGTNKGMSFTFWDSTEETTRGSDSQNAVLYVKNFTVAQDDTTKPTVVVNPFYWNSASENSLYDNSSDNGHIELESDWKNATGYSSTATSGQYDGDPKVSGKITFTGTAYDDMRLGSISVTFGSVLSGTVTATYDSANSVWTVPEKTVASDGYEFSVTDATSSDVGNYGDSVYFDQKGHKVYWTLSIDTAKITNQVGSDVVLTVLAKDAKNNTTAASSITAPVTTSGYTVIDGTTNKPTYQIDVVPYITGVTTTLSNLKKNNPSVYNRTSRGHYPVAADETITFSGFNLGDNTTLDVSTLTASGAYNFSVSGISALNNLNDNDAKGLYDKTVDLTTSPTGSKSIYDNYYNRQPNGDNNNLLTDDVWFDVWEIDPTAVRSKVGGITQPVMAIDPVRDNIGFAFINGTAYFSMPRGTNQKNVDPNSYEYWIGGLDEWNSISLAYDVNGYSYATAAGGDLNASKHGVDIFRFTTSRWDGKGTLSTDGYKNLNNQFGLEYIGEREYFYDESQSKWVDFTNFSKSRIKSPSMATVASASDKSTVYLAYYDSINDEVRFNWGIIKNKQDDSDDEGMFGTHYDAGRISKAYSIGGTSLIAGQTVNKVTSTKPTYASSPVTTKDGTAVYGGEYVSIAAIPNDGDSDDAVVAVWWDGTHHKMLYSYNKTPKSITKGKYKQKDTKWSAPVELFQQEVGEYCKVAVDAAGGIHIAAYDSTNGDVWYAYLQKYDSPSSAKVGCLDSNGFVGSELNIDVALVDDKAVPYISYYASSAAKPKIARWIGGNLTEVSSVSGAENEAFTSNWEVSYVPTSSKLIVDHINVGVWKDSSGVIKQSKTGEKTFTPGSGDTVNSFGTVWGNGTVNPVLGYATKSGSLGYIETAQMK